MSSECKPAVCQGSGVGDDLIQRLPRMMGMEQIRVLCLPSVQPGPCQVAMLYQGSG